MELFFDSGRHILNHEYQKVLLQLKHRDNGQQTQRIQTINQYLLNDWSMETKPQVLTMKGQSDEFLNEELVEL